MHYFNSSSSYKRILPKELYRNLLDYFLDIDIKILESRVKEIKLKNIDSNHHISVCRINLKMDW